MDIDHLKKLYNEEHPNEKSVHNWEDIKKRFHKKCKSGRAECIIAHMLSKPDAPKSWKANPEDWLSSVEIDKLEKKYMKLFKDYYYIDTVPIDFDKKSELGKCLISSLCDLNIKKIYDDNKQRIGIVFNTDVSTGPGQHWIALFCDIRPEVDAPHIVFFDSYGQKPEKEIVRLMERWKKQWDETGIHSKEMELKFSKTRNQYQDSECGMYCLYFHYCSLIGEPMSEKIPDEVVRGFRGLLFR